VPKSEHWLDAPEDHDYPAAADYLSLTFTDAEASAIVEQLRTAEPMWRKAKDLLRASRLDLLGKDDPEVIKDLKRVGQGEKLSPVLLVRRGGGAVLVVADGYHRICASYHLDEDAPIACRLADAQ
jgi:hypothetical protein